MSPAAPIADPGRRPWLRAAAIGAGLLLAPPARAHGLVKAGSPALSPLRAFLPRPA